MVARLTIALVGSASVLLVACGGSSTSSSGPTSSAAVDACLVGTWTTVALSKNSPANDEQIAYSGGAGEVYTINPKGAVTIDTHTARPVVFVSAGETFTATVTGTGRGTLSTIGGSTFEYEASAGDTLTTTVVDSNGAALGPPKPDLDFTAAYTCTKGQSFSFYKNQVSYMIDGPIVSLKAGNSTL